jgi:hypothetical protein
MSIIDQVVETLKTLPASEQRQILGYIQGVAAGHYPPVKSPKLMLAFAGSMDPTYADHYLAVIEEGCEQVDRDEW